MSDPIRLVLVHTLPGRTRLRLAAGRSDVFSLAVAATRLKTMPGVTAVDPRPMTGSLLVLHEGLFPSIGADLPRLGLALVPAADPLPRSPLSAVTVDPAMAGAAGLAALALLQLGRGSVLPPAFTLAWYAGSVLGLLPKTPDAPR